MAPTKGQKKASFVTYLPSLWRVLTVVFSLSRSAIIFKLFGAVLDAALPIATAFLAGLTTTKLVEAFAGSLIAREEIVYLLAATTAVSLTWALWRSINGYIDQNIRFRINAAVSDIMYEKFLSVDFWRYDDKHTNDLKERAERFSRFFGRVFNDIFSSISSLFSFGAAAVALGYVSPLITAGIIVAMIPAALIQIKITRLQLTHWNENIETRRRQYAVEGFLTDANSIVETRIYGLVKHLMQERDQLRAKDEGARILHERRYIRWRFAGDLLENVASFGALFWIVISIANRAQPVGQFIYVQTLVTRIIDSINRIIRQVADFDEDLAYLKDYDEFIRLPRAAHGTASLPEQLPAIELKNVSFAYPNTSNEVLHDITFSIPPGSHVAIVGENGAGKSTLIKILLGMYAPTQGSIEVAGRNLAEFELAGWHDKIGILFQDFNMFTFASVRDNVWYGRIEKDPSPKNVHEALKRAHAYGFVQKLRKREETITSTVYDDEGAKLSGGQWQRLAIARNLFRGSQILILDEPTSAIDAKAEAEIFEEINKEMKGKTVIIVSHRFSTVRKADTIVVLAGGSVVESGTHTELMKKEGLYKEMFDLQAKEYIS